MVFAACYRSDDDLDDNVGETLLINISEDLAKPGLTLDNIKDGNKIKACHFDFNH